MKKILFTLLLSGFVMHVQAQEEEVKKGFQKDRLFVGGNFGLSFGNYTLINLSPQIVSQGVTGLNVFGRLYPTNQLFLQVQPEANYIFGRETYYDTNPHEVYKIDPTIAPSLLLGGGAVFGSGGRGGMIISIMYDVLQHQKSPYGNKPVYNVGFTVGL
jgi:hypothetical protein